MEILYSAESRLSANYIYQNGVPVANLTIEGANGPVQLLGMTQEFLDGLISVAAAMRFEQLGTGNSSGCVRAGEMKYALPHGDGCACVECVSRDYMLATRDDPEQVPPPAAPPGFLPTDEPVEAPPIIPPWPLFINPESVDRSIVVERCPCGMARRFCAEHAEAPIPLPETVEESVHAPWCDGYACGGECNIDTRMVMQEAMMQSYSDRLGAALCR